MRQIIINSKKHGKKVVKIDPIDFDLVSKYTWCLKIIHKTNNFYACSDISKSRSERETISMHRLILNAKNKEIVDHKNGNGLDNRRINLRIVNPSQSSMNRGLSTINTTGFKGVTIGYKGKFKSRIGVNKKRISLGEFRSLTEAAKAYNNAALKYHGEFAKLNII